MPCDVASDFAAARRVTDHYHLTQVERVNKIGKIIRILVHRIAVPRLFRTSVTAAVVGNHAIAVLR